MTIHNNYISFVNKFICPRSSVWIEQKFPKLLVGGSSPLGGTTKNHNNLVALFVFFR